MTIAAPSGGERALSARRSESGANKTSQATSQITITGSRAIRSSTGLLVARAVRRSNLISAAASAIELIRCQDLVLACGSDDAHSTYETIMMKDTARWVSRRTGARVAVHRRPVLRGVGAEHGQFGVPLGDRDHQRAEAADQQEVAGRRHVGGRRAAEHAEHEPGRDAGKLDHRHVLQAR